MFRVTAFMSTKSRNFASDYGIRPAKKAAMVELVDTRDLKSLDPKRSCGFESRSRHFTSLVFSLITGRREKAVRLLEYKVHYHLILL